MSKPVWVGLEKKDLHSFAYGEGGGYINDYLSHRGARWSYTATPIPYRIALAILRPMAHGAGITLDNKEFVKISTPEDVQGHDDRQMHTFLYRHDFTWYLYNLEG